MVLWFVPDCPLAYKLDRFEYEKHGVAKLYDPSLKPPQPATPRLTIGRGSVCPGLDEERRIASEEVFFARFKQKAKQPPRRVQGLRRLSPINTEPPKLDTDPQEP